MENKKKPVGLIILVVILSLALVGTIGYILYDKTVVSNNKETVENKSDIEENNKVDEAIDLKEDDPMVKALFEYLTPWCPMYGEHSSIRHIIENDGVYKAEDMTEMEKIRMASSLYNSHVQEINYEDGTSDRYIDENIIKRYYELIFGVGTYKTMDKIYYATGGYLTYNQNKKQYEAIKSGGLGGTCLYKTSNLSGKKYSDRIELTFDVTYAINSNEKENTYTLKYIYKLADNGSYVLYSGEKIK